MLALAAMFVMMHIVIEQEKESHVGGSDSSKWGDPNASPRVAARPTSTAPARPLRRLAGSSQPANPRVDSTT